MAQVSAFIPERRIKQRFNVTTSVSYRVQLVGTRCQHTGKGRTVNMSSDGVLFRAEGLSLPVGALLELSVAWPVKLNERVGLKLLVVGSVVRRHDDCLAVKVQRAEFRTTKSAVASDVPSPMTAELPSGLVSQRNSV